VPRWREAGAEFDHEARPTPERVYVLQPHVCRRKAEFIARFLEHRNVKVASTLQLSALCAQYETSRASDIAFLAFAPCLLLFLLAYAAKLNANFGLPYGYDASVLQVMAAPLLALCIEAARVAWYGLPYAVSRAALPRRRHLWWVLRAQAPVRWRECASIYGCVLVGMGLLLLPAFLADGSLPLWAVMGMLEGGAWALVYGTVIGGYKEFRRMDSWTCALCVVLLWSLQAAAWLLGPLLPLLRSAGLVDWPWVVTSLGFMACLLDLVIISAILCPPFAYTQASTWLHCNLACLAASFAMVQAQEQLYDTGAPLFNFGWMFLPLLSSVVTLGYGWRRLVVLVQAEQQQQLRDSLTLHNTPRPFRGRLLRRDYKRLQRLVSHDFICAHLRAANLACALCRGASAPL
jgi:hypothetical protein